MEKPSKLRPDRGHKKDVTVLIVDDEPEQIEGIELAIKQLGWKVYYADDGNKGLALLKTVSPDLVLLDLSLPGRSGIIFLETMRAEDNSTSRVIVLTGIDGRRHHDYAMALGADAYFRKPYSIDDVLSKARELVG